MFRNQHSKTIQASWKGINLNFTAELRINKNGEKGIVFFVEALSNVHVKTYALCWRIEMMFRTCKQYLGLQHCSSRGFESQKLHVLLVLFCYTFLQYYIDWRLFKNVEDLIKHLLKVKNYTLTKRITSFI